jgi:hypothetical protein
MKIGDKQHINDSRSNLIRPVSMEFHGEFHALHFADVMMRE